MHHRTLARLVAISAAAGLAAAALGQDSVALVPGDSDALLAYDNDGINRYVVDLVPLVSSWGNQYRIGPILKAHADDDPLFPTQLLGSVAVSPDQLLNPSFAPISYKVWSTPGAGINPARNSTPGALSRSTYTRQFGVGFTDLSTVPTNTAGAVIGQDASNPSRLFVSRVLAASSRYSPEDDNTCTVSLGAIDARGFLFLRADNFGGAGAQIVGENIVRVNTAARNNFLATLYWNGATNSSDQPSAITYLVNNSPTTTNVPAVIPQAAGAGLAAVLDFSNKYRPNGAAGVSTHLAAGIEAHRGNPSFSAVNDLGGVGTVASLARATGATRTQSLNLFGVTAAGAVASARGATMPIGITDGAFTANTTGEASFHQYLSQTTFRGGSGQVGVGRDPLTNTYIAAATAKDPTQGEFIAVARFGASVTWTVAAFAGKPVLDGPSGMPIGAIAAASPAALSAPAADLQGNIYFVAAFQPTVGPLTTALIRAVNTPAGYRLERLLAAGQSFAGANSGRTYTVERLILGDSDSVASGSFFSGNLLQPAFPGENPVGPADPRSMGGAVVNALITYDNAGIPESYYAVLFVGAQIAPPPPECTGDANNDGFVNFTDITAVLSNFGATYPPGSGGMGDANNDGFVNFADITAVLSNFGADCN